MRRDLKMEKYAALMVLYLVSGLQGLDASTRTVSMQTLCGTRVGKKDAWRLRSHDGVDVTSGDVLQPECTFVLQAFKTSQSFLVSFEEYFILQDDAPVTPSTPTTNATNFTQTSAVHVSAGCSNSFLQIWDGDVINDVSHLRTVCGSSENPQSPLDVIESQTQFLTVRLTVHPTATVNVTVVTTSFDSGPCTDGVTELKCRNGRCVPRTVRCDNSNNCGDNTDQLVSPPANCTLARTVQLVDFPWEILLAVLGGILAAFLLYWLCWRPGYLPWRLAYCRNLVRGCFQECCKGCCRKCTSRPYPKLGRCASHCCCCKVRSPNRFGGCCYGNEDADEKRGDIDETSSATGNRAQSDGMSGNKTRKSGGGAGTSYLCCPCGKQGQRTRSDRDEDEKGLDMAPQRDLVYADNGGDGGHVRESR